MTSETRLVISDLAGKRTEQMFDPVDKERAELECFAEAIKGGVYPVTDQQVLHSIAVIEATVASLAQGMPIEPIEAHEAR